MLINLHNASFGYGRNRVLSDLSLSIQEGDFIGVVGVNGSGKSTLMKGVLGLLKPMHGRVDRAPNVIKRIGYVPQRGQLDPIYPLTVYDIVRMGVRHSQSARPFILKCLEKVRMSAHVNQPFAALSGGQQQRVLIARALAVDPLILVLDEPTSGVDAVTENEIVSFLSDINEKEKIAILLVSHKIPVLYKYAKTVLFLQKEGLLMGPAREILAHEKWEKILEDVL